MNTIDTLKLLSENWFLQEPAFFSLLCQQQLEENVRMECAIRCGQGRIEYNPLLLSKKNYAEVEQLMRVEMIRLFLKHPYERQPEGCSKEAISIGSDITIGDGYCMLHKDKLPVHDPAFYHLPLGQYFEWYAKQIQQQKQDEEKKDQNDRNDWFQAFKEHAKRHFGKQNGNSRQHEHNRKRKKVFTKKNDNDK